MRKAIQDVRRNGWTRHGADLSESLIAGSAVLGIAMLLGACGARSYPEPPTAHEPGQLTEVEDAFRIHKTDLRVRPIWHQKEQRVDAHILVCFLAYVVWRTLGQMCKRAGLGDEPRRVLEELSRIRLVDVVLRTRGGQEIRRRCAPRPDDPQAILLHRLGLALPEYLPVTDEKTNGL